MLRQVLQKKAPLVAQMGKNLPAVLETWDCFLGQEVGHGNPLQYSCLGNPMERRAWLFIKFDASCFIFIQLKIFSNFPCGFFFD